MAKQQIRYERERSYPMSVAEAWRILADTDHLNRSIGLPAVEFSDLPDPLLRRARARKFGVVPVRWKEFPFDWIRETRYTVRREFEQGPIARVEGGIELVPTTDGVTVKSFAEFMPANVTGRLARRVIRKSVTDLLEYCDRYLVRKQTGLPDPVPVPKQRPRVDRPRLERLVSELRRSPVLPELVPRLRERIAEGSDDQLVGIRPFALADAWGADPFEVLRLFLYATRVGLFEMRWELMCPNCRVPKAETETLSKLPTQFHCDVCGVAYDVDFDRRVELRFSVHPAVRIATDQVYCIGGPLRMPHLVAQQYLRPHEDRRVDLPHSGPLRLRTVRATHHLSLAPAPGEARERDVTVTYASGRWVGPHSLTHDETLAIPDGAHLVLRNQTDGAILAVVEDPTWTAAATTAAQVTTLQEFQDLFSSEVLAPGHQLAVSHVALLFSDLKGSTQLYEGIGDAPAYSRVNRHFDFIHAAVTRGRGTIVKTMGDGVMCAFHQLDNALDTAISMQEQIVPWCQEQGIDPPLTLKLGAHEGPVIAMTANDHLDYFGRTVNLAARIGEQSRGGDIVVLRDLLNRASSSLFVDHAGVVTESFNAQLRGFESEQNLVRLVVTPGFQRLTAMAAHSEQRSVVETPEPLGGR
jgi:adenylate cyclase